MVHVPLWECWDCPPVLWFKEHTGPSVNYQFGNADLGKLSYIHVYIHAYKYIGMYKYVDIPELTARTDVRGVGLTRLLLKPRYHGDSHLMDALPAPGMGLVYESAKGTITFSSQ